MPVEKLVEHRLTDILVIAVCAVIVCADYCSDLPLPVLISAIRAASVRRHGVML